MVLALGLRTLGIVPPDNDAGQVLCDATAIPLRYLRA